MSATPTSPDLFPETGAAVGVTVVNDHCLVRSADEQRIVVVRGVPVAVFVAGDRMAEAYAMVLLVDQGHAQQRDVARAFGCTARTVRRCQVRFAGGGLAALARQPGYPSGRPRRVPGRDRAVLALRRKGLSNRAVGRQMGLDEKTVRKTLRKMGWSEPRPQQGALDLGPAAPPGADPNLSAALPGPASAEAVEPVRLAGDGADPNLSAADADDDRDAEPLAPTADHDPADRSGDRLLAYLGMLDDARPMFASAPRVQGAGVLLAVPALVATGVLHCAREVYGGLGPAFYGLRTTVMTLLLMALLRVRRPEGLKERCPVEFGRVLGLDRAPEVKTVRRKLKRLAGLGRAADFGRALALHRTRTHGEALGFLYVDGHVRVYHGKHTLPKAHVTRMRISMPATTDYWVNDRDGDPLFVVTAQANAGLVAVLPGLLAQARALVGERRVTVVFDRGGWSPKLFRVLVRDGFDVLTYRKGRSVPVPAERFAVHEAGLDGRRVRYTLADQTVYLPTPTGRLRMRQVTRLTDDGHQTQILTSRRDLPAVEVAWRMFERWRQENFFKYLRDEFALDALAEHGVEPDDPARTVPNPARRSLDDELRKLNAELAKPETDLALRACFDPQRLHDPEFWRVGHDILAKIRRRLDVQRERDALPKRVPVGTVAKGPVVKLAAERKLLTTLLKMVAYQAETELVRTVAPHYRRTDDEGRTLVQTALAAPAELQLVGDELRVRLAPLSSPHRSRALAALCRELDTARTKFPGTRITLRFQATGDD